MKDKNMEKTAKDEELGMNEENKISTKTFDSIKDQGEKKLNIRDTEELARIGTNADNPNTKVTKRKSKKMVSLVLAITPLIILAGMIYFLSSPYGQN